MITLHNNNDNDIHTNDIVWNYVTMRLCCYKAMKLCDCGTVRRRDHEPMRRWDYETMTNNPLPSHGFQRPSAASHGSSHGSSHGIATEHCPRALAQSCESTHLKRKWGRCHAAWRPRYLTSNPAQIHLRWGLQLYQIALDDLNVCYRLRLRLRAGLRLRLILRLGLRLRLWCPTSR